MYTLGTENYSFDDITTDLTQCPAYPAMTCISFIAMGGTFPFQITAQQLAMRSHTLAHIAHCVGETNYCWLLCGFNFDYFSNENLLKM